MVTSSPGELVLWFVTWGQGEENIIGRGGVILGGYWDGGVVGICGVMHAVWILCMVHV